RNLRIKVVRILALELLGYLQRSGVVAFSKKLVGKVDADARLRHELEGLLRERDRPGIIERVDVASAQVDVGRRILRLKLGKQLVVPALFLIIHNDAIVVAQDFHSLWLRQPLGKQRRLLKLLLLITDV